MPDTKLPRDAREGVSEVIAAFTAAFTPIEDRLVETFRPEKSPSSVSFLSNCSSERSGGDAALDRLIFLFLGVISFSNGAPGLGPYVSSRYLFAAALCSASDLPGDLTAFIVMISDVNHD